jgi:hypothetical protein
MDAEEKSFYVWLSIFTVLLGTAPFAYWQGYHVSGVCCGVIGLGGLLMFISPPAKRLNDWPIRTSLQILAVAALSVLVSQLIAAIYHNQNTIWRWSACLAGTLILVLAVWGTWFQRKQDPLLPIQRELLELSRDLRRMLKDAGPQPMPKFAGPLKEGQDQKAWTDQWSADTNKWQDAYSEWARKIIYRYREEFAGRVKKVMNSLGLTTGMVVAPLEPYASDVRPGDDFNNLIDLLIGFFAKLENPKPSPISRAMLSQPAVEMQNQKQPSQPDTSIKDTDPHIEIKFSDLRGVTGSSKPEEQSCFDLINRGKYSPAKFVCIEDFNIGGYRVVFRHFPPPIAPFNNHESICPLYINRPDGKLCITDIFAVFAAAFGDLHNHKLYEYPVPMKATYQDEGGNLFEVRCDLVFYPSEAGERAFGKKGNTVIETKNQKIRKVALASHPVDWS